MDQKPDLREFWNFNFFPEQGEKGTLYIDLEAGGMVYFWNGSSYTKIEFYSIDEDDNSKRIERGLKPDE